MANKNDPLVFFPKRTPFKDHRKLRLAREIGRNVLLVGFIAPNGRFFANPSDGILGARDVDFLPWIAAVPVKFSNYINKLLLSLVITCDNCDNP